MRLFAAAVYVYLADQDDSGTDTDTSSDYGEDADNDGWAPNSALPASEQAAELYWAYARAKAKWRSFMGKPTRKARRFARRAFRSGKGGKSKYGKEFPRNLKLALTRPK